MIPQSTINACVKAWYGTSEDTDFGKIQAVLMQYEQLRAAAREGGADDLIGLMRVPDGMDYASNVDSLLDDLSNILMGCVSNGEYERVNNAIVRSYTHPSPEVARDAERWRVMRDSWGGKLNSEKGYLTWYLPRSGRGFQSLEEHIDSIIDSKSRADTAIDRAMGDAAGVG